jgi:hypothetical protein
LNNVVLDKKGVFGVGNSVPSCPKGLWLWMEPDPSAPKRALLILDSQGYGDPSESTSTELQMLGLMVLLSTTFIWNCVGGIDKSALTSLSLVINSMEELDKEK